MHDVEGDLSDQLLGLVAEQRAARGRDVRAHAPRVDARDQVARVLGEQAEALLRLRQRCHHELLLGDVDERRDEARDDAVDAQGARIHRDEAQRAVRHPHAEQLADHVAAGLERDAGGRLLLRQDAAVEVHAVAVGDRPASDQLGARAAEDLLRCRVDVRDRALCVAQDDALVEAVEHLPQPEGGKTAVRVRPGRGGGRAHVVCIGRFAGRHYPAVILAWRLLARGRRCRAARGVRVNAACPTRVAAVAGGRSMRPRSAYGVMHAAE